ncbi:MAG: hypothetical protein WBM39_08085, partial [Parasphingorhabdus sp.]
MKIATLFGAMALLSACSMSIIPQGAAQGRATQQEGEWVTGGSPDVSAPQPAQQSYSKTKLRPVDPARLMKIGTDTTRALGTGVAAGPDIATLNVPEAKAISALNSFRT